MCLLTRIIIYNIDQFSSGPINQTR